MRRIVAMIIFCLLLFSAAFADSLGNEVSKNIEVGSEDQALGLTSNDKGLTLVADIRNLVGIVDGLDGTVVDLNQTINDLGGKIKGDLLFLELSADVLFDFDKADIKPAVIDTLEKVALVINKKARGVVSIIGHTDSKGSEEYNQKLSLRRAQAIMNWLIEKGGSTAEYRVEGRGESEPVAENSKADGSDNPEGRARNRRVNIIIPVEDKS